MRVWQNVNFVEEKKELMRKDAMHSEIDSVSELFED